MSTIASSPHIPDRADTLELGVCYYPEQWPRTLWEDDARRMAELGLAWVRIGEFAWSKIEPTPGRYEWDWMDDAIAVLGSAGLKVILGTPTAAPPKWLVDRYPEILPVDASGKVRKFGARRHYCFSSTRYRMECERILTALADRYGSSPLVHAWQTDNEYGDHDTVHSYSEEALKAFRSWLAERYRDIETLNTAWGTAFWSMHYNGFNEIELPNNLVDEATPTHLLDFARFSSDQVRAFNLSQVEIIRAHAPGRPVTHNFMSHNTDFDHYAVGSDLDIASWDSYPMGGLLNGRLSQEDKLKFLRSGDPDQPAFNHDLYRRVGRGRVWVMEQQPGPVNWAAYNQSPADGMVRLWTWLAYAHGVDMVSFFRWRQAPYAQEQFHAGLLLPNNVPDQGHREVAQVAHEIKSIPAGEERGKADVALVLDYASRWASGALPQGRGYSGAQMALDWYAALARVGVEVDIVAPNDDFGGYDLVLVPDVMIDNPDMVCRLQACTAKVLIGPRSGSKTENMHIPATLPPGSIVRLVDLSVTRVESLPPYHSESIRFGNELYPSTTWRESITTCEPVLATFEGNYRGGSPALVGNDKCRYLAAVPSGRLLAALMADTLAWAGVPALSDLGDMRIARRGKLRFAFNFGNITTIAPADPKAQFLVGSRSIAPNDLAIWIDTQTS